MRKAWLQDRDVVGWRHLRLPSLTCLPTKNMQVSRVDFLHKGNLKSRGRGFPFGTLLYGMSGRSFSLTGPKNCVWSARTAIVEERKIDLVARELDRYNIDVAALQETWWFGSAACRINKSTNIFLTAGRPTPGANQPHWRREGVALVLSGPVVDVWKLGGKQWKVCGSRLVKTLLATGKRVSDCIHVISCYAPTLPASEADKSTFYDNLQQALNEVPSRELYLVLGDFNARVGSRCLRLDQWDGALGPHRLGKVNDAGKHLLLSFPKFSNNL